MYFKAWKSTIYTFFSLPVLENRSLVKNKFKTKFTISVHPGTFVHYVSLILPSSSTSSALLPRWGCWGSIRLIPCWGTTPKLAGRSLWTAPRSMSVNASPISRDDAADARFCDLVRSKGKLGRRGMAADAERLYLCPRVELPSLETLSP